MKPALRWTVPAMVLALGIVVGLARAPSMLSRRTCWSRRRSPPRPALDGALDDGWKAAPALTVKAVGGKNLPGGSTEVTLRSVYAGDTIYFLVQYKDATDSVKRGPWVKQADGSWKQLKDPTDKGGDNNLYYEDKMAMIWNISSPAFEQRGCMGACHTGEGKPYGNKYTADRR